MIRKNKLFVSIMTYFLLSFSAFAENTILAKEISKVDGGQWIVEKENDLVNLKFINAKGITYSNKTIVTSDVESDNLFISIKSNGDMNLTMNYPRDIYSFDFSSTEIPYLLSACKQIMLPSVDKKQAVTLLTLCFRKNDISQLILNDVDANNLFNPGNLTLNGKVKTIIGVDKAFLYNNEGNRLPRNPYLIKGDVIEVLEYKKSFLKIRYKSKFKDMTNWIRFEDVL